MSDHSLPSRPRFGRIPTAVQYSGFSRSRIYELAVDHEGLIRKDNSASLVDFDVLDQILDELPAGFSPQGVTRGRALRRLPRRKPGSSATTPDAKVRGSA